MFNKKRYNQFLISNINQRFGVWLSSTKKSSDTIQLTCNLGSLYKVNPSSATTRLLGLYSFYLPFQICVTTRLIHTTVSLPDTSQLVRSSTMASCISWNFIKLATDLSNNPTAGLSRSGVIINSYSSLCGTTVTDNTFKFNLTCE